MTTEITPFKGGEGGGRMVFNTLGINMKKRKMK